MKYEIHSHTKETSQCAKITAKELVDNEVSVTTEERHLLAQEMKRLFTRVALN